MLAGGAQRGRQATPYELAIAPRFQAPFINADLIQRQKSRNDPMAAAYTSAGIAEKRRQVALKQGLSFVSN